MSLTIFLFLPAHYSLLLLLLPITMTITLQVRTVVKIAVLLSDQELWDEALLMHRRALAGFENYYGMEYPETIDEAHFIGELLLRAEEIPEAEEMLRRALAGRRRLFTGSAHPKTMDSAHFLAFLVQKQTKWKHDPRITARIEETEALYTEALAGRDAALGPDHEDSIETARCLAAFLFEEDRVLEAEHLCKRVYDSRLIKFGEKSVLTATAAYSLGIILQTSRKFFRGIEAFRVAIVGFEHEYEPDKAQKDVEKAKRRAEKEREWRKKREERRAKMRGDSKDADPDDDLYDDDDDDDEFVDSEDDREEDVQFELADCRASYENCLKMNAIG
jgi:tetratricopeptide (TPR) repeat protein